MSKRQNAFMKRRGASAWVVEWEVDARYDLPGLDKRPHILPYRWRSQRVGDYIRCLYWNSQTPYGTIRNINQQKPPGIWVTDTYYGDTMVHLHAVRVKDLMISKKDRTLLMEWTRPGRTEWNSHEEQFVKVAPDVRRQFEYLLPGKE